MSSAGSGSSLFGDRRAVLILDMSERRAGEQQDSAVLPIIEVDLECSKSSYRTLLRFLRPYHSPPEVTGTFRSLLVL